MDIREIVLKKQLELENEKNKRIMKIIENANPKFAKHMFQENSLIEKFIVKQSGGLDLLNQPVCEICEKPVAWDIDGAYCFRCDHKTKNPKKVSDYLVSVLKGFSDEEIAIMNRIGE